MPFWSPPPNFSVVFACAVPNPDKKTNVEIGGGGGISGVFELQIPCFAAETEFISAIS